MRTSPLAGYPDRPLARRSRRCFAQAIGMALWAWLMVGVVAGAEMDAPAPPSGVRIKKVLPHWLDKQGRHLLSPSLLERDAYQALLRKEPERRGGLRFDVQCGTLPAGASFVLKVEIRGSRSNTPTFVALEKALPSKARFNRWQSLPLSAEQFESLGELVAWRATLWSANQPVAEQKSFLW